MSQSRRYLNRPDWKAGTHLLDALIEHYDAMDRLLSLTSDEQEDKSSPKRGRRGSNPVQ